MARQVTCYGCTQKGDKELMVKESNKKYYHLDLCHQEYLVRQKFLDKEKRQKDALYEKIMKVHGLKNSQEIPTLFYMKVEQVRNDSGLLGRYNKKYKEGVPYSGITYTYDYCIDDINKALFAKSDEPLLSKMNYCFGIVRNNIVDAYNHVKNNNKQKDNVVKLVASIEASSEISGKIKKVQMQQMQNKEEDKPLDLTSLFD